MSYCLRFLSGKTDPYVVLSLGDQIIRSKKNSQTTVIGPPGEPIWNQVKFSGYLIKICARSYSLCHPTLFQSESCRTTIDHVYVTFGRIFICLLQTLENKNCTSK